MENRHQQKKKSTYIPVFIIFVCMVFVFPLVHAQNEFVSQELTANKLYDSSQVFRINDTQTFYISQPAIITEIRIIAKTDIAVYNAIQLNLRDTINNTMGQTLQSVLSSPIKTYFSEISFPIQTGVTTGTYWLDFGGTTYHSFYSDSSAIDTYSLGSVNGEVNTHDLYFVVMGYYINESESIQITQSNSMVEEFFGTDSIVLFIVSLVVIFGVMVFIKQRIKNDYIVIGGVIFITIGLWMVGMLSFYIAGVFIIADIIVTFGLRGETDK